MPACLLALMIVFVSQSFAQNRVTLTWQVQKYDLKVTMPQNPDAQRDLDVMAELTLKNVTSSAFSRATLRISDQATIKSVTANGATADFASAKEAAVAGRALQRIATRIPSVGPGQTVMLLVSYTFNVRANDGLASLSSSGFQLLPSAFWFHLDALVLSSRNCRIYFLCKSKIIDLLSAG